MLVATLPGPTSEEIEQQLFQVQDKVDIVELRPDLYACANLIEISKKSSKPLMISGGRGISRYLDIPFDQWNENLIKQFPDTQLICSYHNFKETPENLNEIFEAMPRGPIIKMATMAHSALDGFRMLKIVREAKRRGIKFVGHCMGEAGQFTRVLGKIFGNYCTYCTAGEPVAPGQMSFSEMLDVYSFASLNADTRIYGLIGDPVKFSQGHIVHNRFFRENGLNAVYVKIPVKKDEVSEVLSEARELGISGFSVTMPLKEVVCPGFVYNTLKFEGDRVVGTNTDGIGAVSLVKKRGPLKGKRAVMVGWGGAAKAIAAELEKEGVQLLILNRTPGGRVRPLADWETLDLSVFDIVIQGTNVGMGSDDQSPVDASRLLPRHIVLEVVSHPMVTKFLGVALQKGCDSITGREMFLQQAAFQYNFWGLKHVPS